MYNSYIKTLEVHYAFRTTIRYQSPVNITMSLDEAITLQQSLVKIIATHAKGYGIKDKKTDKMVAAEMCGGLTTLTEDGQPASFGLIVTVVK